MALHRDIYWIGRQWAVTGAGIQAVDQRLKGEFDIPCAHLQSADLIEALREMPWFNEADFIKAYAVARDRFFDTAGRLVLPKPSSVTDIKPKVPPPAPTRLRLGPQPAVAKFLPQWRVRR